MTEPHAYLAAGLVGPSGKGLAPTLAGQADLIARHWLDAGVDLAFVELASELLARWAAGLGQARVGADELVAALATLGPIAPSLESFVRCAAAACARGLGATELAALAVHWVDIGEAMAVRVFVPELPSLMARADRSGDAARSVGVARHLRG